MQNSCHGNNNISLIIIPINISLKLLFLFKYCRHRKIHTNNNLVIRKVIILCSYACWGQITPPICYTWRNWAHQNQKIFNGARNSWSQIFIKLSEYVMVDILSKYWTLFFFLIMDGCHGNHLPRLAFKAAK